MATPFGKDGHHRGWQLLLVRARADPVPGLLYPTGALASPVQSVVACRVVCEVSRRVVDASPVSDRIIKVYDRKKVRCAEQKLKYWFRPFTSSPPHTTPVTTFNKNARVASAPSFAKVGCLARGWTLHAAGITQLLPGDAHLGDPLLRARLPRRRLGH